MCFCDSCNIFVEVVNFGSISATIVFAAAIALAAHIVTLYALPLPLLLSELFKGLI